MPKDIKNFQTQNTKKEGQQVVRDDSILNLIKVRNLYDNPIIILYHLRHKNEISLD